MRSCVVFFILVLLVPISSSSSELSLQWEYKFRNALVDIENVNERITEIAEIEIPDGSFYGVTEEFNRSVREIVRDHHNLLSSITIYDECACTSDRSRYALLYSFKHSTELMSDFIIFVDAVLRVSLANDYPVPISGEIANLYALLSEQRSRLNNLVSHFET